MFLLVPVGNIHVPHRKPMSFGNPVAPAGQCDMRRNAVTPQRGSGEGPAPTASGSASTRSPADTDHIDSAARNSRRSDWPVLSRDAPPSRGSGWWSVFTWPYVAAFARPMTHRRTFRAQADSAVRRRSCVIARNKCAGEGSPQQGHVFRSPTGRFSSDS